MWLRPKCPMMVSVFVVTDPKQAFVRTGTSIQPDKTITSIPNMLLWLSNFVTDNLHCSLNSSDIRRNDASNLQFAPNFAFCALKNSKMRRSSSNNSVHRVTPAKPKTKTSPADTAGLGFTVSTLRRSDEYIHQIAPLRS